jgi:hypothetical protein
MKFQFRRLLPVLALLLYAGFVIAGLGDVPFHPDESSILYQSRDLDVFLVDPKSLAWEPSISEDDDLNYRLLNAPLVKYIIGIGRRLVGYQADTVSVDWNWSLGWEENAAAGALPDQGVLLVSRFAISLLLPCSVVLIYLCGIKLSSHTTAALAATILAANGSILLHGRRAMAEGALIFGVCLAIYGMLVADRKPWLNGIGFAVAVCSKYTAAALLPVSLLANVWTLQRKGKHAQNRIRNLLLFAGFSVTLTLLMHPLLWSHPKTAAKQMWIERQALVEGQTSMLRAIAPQQVMDTTLERMTALLGHVFIAPLQFEEVGNYIPQTAQSVREYLDRPWHTLFRGSVSGGLLLTLTLFGIAIGICRLCANHDAYRRRALSLLLFGSLALAGGLLLMNPLNFQRYYIPLVPFVALWSAYGIDQWLQKAKEAVPEEDSPSQSTS